MSINEADLYKLSRSLDLMVNIIKKININSDTFTNIYKYSKVIDISPRGFNCTNAVALYRDICKQEKISPQELNEVINLLHQLIALNNIEDIKTMIMDEKAYNSED